MMKTLFKGKPEQSNYQISPEAPMLRIVLYKNEICRLPQMYQEIRAISGNAWVTVGGRDKFLVRGQRFSLPTYQDDFALVSALGDTPLVLELRGTKPSSQDLVRLIPQRQAC